MELRAKYTPEQIEKLGKEGRAFKAADGSYTHPVGDEKDLKTAIRSVLRGDQTHDPVRKYVLERAAALKLGDLTPDNWGSDGTLKETNGAWATAEQRDTARDTIQALEYALIDAYEGQYERWSVWVQDWDGESAGDSGYRVIYQAGSEIYARDFSFDEDGKIILGEDIIKVRPISLYVERSQESRTQNLSHTIAMRKDRMPRRGEREIRTVPIKSLELREGEVTTQATEDSDGRALLRFVGYASVFDQRYSVGFYEEIIARGAFKRALAAPSLDCVLRMEHVDLPIARTTGTVILADGTEQATLALSEDDDGLRVEALLDAEDPDVRRLIPKMRRKDLSEMSFAFRCADDTWSEDRGLRTVRVAELHRGDVSIVTYGASPTTNSTIRSEETLAILRSAGVGGFVDVALELIERATVKIEGRGEFTSATIELLLGLGEAFGCTPDEARAFVKDLAELKRNTPAAAQTTATEALDFTSLARAQFTQLGARR